MSTELNGLLPVIQTPYLADETIDWQVLSHEIDWLFDQGIDGLVIAMASEVLRLTESERRELTEQVCRLVADRGPVVASVGAESFNASEALARHAQESGASAVMAIPPIATACPEAELKRYYERILNAISIPVIVQDASGYVGRPLSIEFQAELLREHGPRIMFKPEAQPLAQKVSELRDATEGKASIFEGSGGIALVDSYQRGVTGTMPGADLIRVMGALWRSLEKGNDQDAWQISTAILPLLSLLNSLDAFLAVEKHLLVRQGVFTNAFIRGPVDYRLDAETRDEVDRLFDLALAVTQRVETACIAP